MFSCQRAGGWSEADTKIDQNALNDERISVP